MRSLDGQEKQGQPPFEYHKVSLYLHARRRRVQLVKQTKCLVGQAMPLVKYAANILEAMAQYQLAEFQVRGRVGFLCALILAMSLVLSATPSQAQSDGSFTQIFEERLQELETDAFVEQLSPVDDGRGSILEGGRGVTQEGAKLDQLKLKRMIERLEPSALERDFSDRAGTELTQFGYDLFQLETQDQMKKRLIRSAGAVVQDDYILGVGDELVVTFHGQYSKFRTTQVDREGRVVLRELPPISAAGRTFGDFRREIQALVEMTLLDTDIYISIGKIRDISVLVVGEVESPGIFKVPALSTILDAISVSGGIKKTGSLRRLQVHRGEEIFWIDLYDLIFLGTLSRDLILHDGDRIVVQTLGDTAAAAGWVKRPGIYELAEGETSTLLSDLIALGGGTVRPRGSRYLHISLEADGRQKVEESRDPGTTRIAAGDIVIVEISQNVQIGNVMTEGHVRVANRRSLASAPTLSALLTDGSILGPTPYLLFAAVETNDTRTRTRRLYAANLESVLTGQVDYRLHDQDVVLIFSAENVEYLKSAAVQRLLMRDDGDEQYHSYSCLGLKELEIVVSLSNPGKYSSAMLYLDDLSTGQKSELETLTIKERMRHDIEQRRLVLEERKAKLGEVRARMEADPLQSDLLEKTFNELDNPDCPQLFEKYPKALPFLLEHAILLQGEVRAPGIYPIVDGTPLASVVAAAGGTTRDADLAHVEMTSYSLRSHGTAEIDRQVRDLSQTRMADALVGPGDSVQIGTVFSDRDLGLVTLSGEFKRPGRYTIRRGERLSELVERAGGLTPHAYPYGAVFTRQSAKKREKRGFERTAQELENTLATALTSGGTSGSRSLGVASQTLANLVETLRSTKPVGRMVMEADPTVLQIRPDLDIVLEPGDRLVMPKRPSSVTVTGEVLSPGAMQFARGLHADDYIDMSGGVGQAGDKQRIFVVLPNGVAKPVSVSFWNYDPFIIPPGSTVVVPRDATPFEFLNLAKDLTAIFSQLAIGAASLAVLSDN